MPDTASLHRTSAVVWRDGEPCALPGGEIGVGAGPDGSVALALIHPDGTRMVALLGPIVMNAVAIWMAEAVEADNAAELAAGAGATLQ